MEVFAAFMYAVVRALAVPAGMDAHAPCLAHEHAVAGAHLLLHGHSIHRAQDLGRQPQVCIKILGYPAVPKSEANF